MTNDIIRSDEVNQGHEITLTSSSEDIQSYLVSGANEAVGATSFSGRNDTMAKTVARESSLLAAKSIGSADERDIEDIFAQASVESGQEFSVVFDEFGNPKKNMINEYNQAMKKAGAIALKYLPSLYKNLGINIDVVELARKVNFNDALVLTASQLGVDFQPLNPDEIKRILDETAKGDYFEDQIDSLPFSSGEPLTTEEQNGLDLAVRLANTTWKAGQVHRASWEGNTDRINPDKREAFNPYDLLKQRQFERVIKEGRSQNEALVRVAFEVWKDIAQYKDLPQVKQ